MQSVLWFRRAALMSLAFPMARLTPGPGRHVPLAVGVSVSPTNGTDPTNRYANSTGNTDTFTVTNTGDVDTRYSGTCTVGGNVTSVSCTSIGILVPGEQKKVIATFSVGAAGTGTITLSVVCQMPTGCSGSGKWNITIVNPPHVSITPDGGAATAPANSTGNQVTFTASETGGQTGDQVSLSCPVAGAVSSCTLNPAGPISLGAGQSTTVTATYSTTAAGSGTVTLHGVGTSNTDDGYFNVTVNPVGAPVVDLGPYNYTKQDYGLCAVSCFATVYAQSTVPYFSLDAARSVTLVYNSDRVNPRPFVHVNVMPDAGWTPTEYRFQVKVNGTFVTFVNGDQTLRFTNPGAVYARLGGQFDASSLSTRVYPLDIIVAAYYSATDQLITSTVSTRLVVVNETSSPIAAGWTLGGVQQLYPQGDGSALITEGDGGHVYFAYQGGAFVSPAGEFSTLVPGSAPSRWVRLYPDSSRTVFDSTGRMTQLVDRFGNATTVTYDGSGRVSQIKDPLNLAITLGYGSNGLATIQDPGSPVRTTGVNVDAARKLTAITDPDNVATNFVFDGTFQLLDVINRRGDTTQYGYNASRKLCCITFPQDTVFATAVVVAAPSETRNPWQEVGVPYSSTASTPAQAPRADTVRAYVTDARGFTTRFQVDRFGAPTEILDALARTTTLTRDANSLVLRTSLPSGGVDSAVYNTSGLPTLIEPAGLSATNIQYDGVWNQPSNLSGTGQPTVQNFIGQRGRVDSTLVGGQAKSRYTYDSFGRVLTATDPQGHLLVQHTYAGTNGNLSRDSLPGNRITTYAYDAYGRDTLVTPPGVVATRTRYDLLNRTLATYRVGGGTDSTVYTYDPLFLTQVRDPKGQIFGFTYNKLGWLKQRTDPQGKSDKYLYDKTGNLMRWVNRRALPGDSVKYVYDELGRRTDKSGPNTSHETWSYSTDGRVLTGGSPVSTETLYLNVQGQPDSVRTVIAGRIYWRRYQYTPAGLRSSLTGTIWLTEMTPRTYTYNSGVGTLDQITLGSAPTSTRRNADLVDSISVRPQLDSSLKSYSSVHGQSAITAPGTPYSKYIYHTYQLDGLGRITSMADSAALSRQYHRAYWYSWHGELIETDFETTQPCQWDPDYGWQCGGQVVDSTRSFLYDANGNRTDHGATYSPPTSNRLTGFNACSYTEDDDGNVTGRTCGGVTATFTWSSDNRLTSATWGGNTATYQYDAFGRLVRANDPGSGDAGVRFYVWDGDQLYTEVDSVNGTPVRDYSWYPGADQLHAVIDGIAHYYATQDGFGNVIALTSENRSLTRWYLWDEWGTLAGGADLAGWNGTDRVRFKGALLMNAGLDLYYMRNRWYEPWTGRFLSEDPIGLAGGINPYVFAGNDPLNGSDPAGLFSGAVCGPIDYHYHTCGWGGGMSWETFLWLLGARPGYVDYGSRPVLDPNMWGRDGGGTPEPQPTGCVALGAPLAGDYPISSPWGTARSIGTNPHRGIDYAAPVGTPVLAVLSGVVYQAGPAGGAGFRLGISHAGGLYTRYLHLSTWRVGVGDTIVAGSVIGLSGATGLATGPHLHFEVFRDFRQTLNPEGCIR